MCRFICSFIRAEAYLRVKAFVVRSDMFIITTESKECATPLKLQNQLNILYIYNNCHFGKWHMPYALAKHMFLYRSPSECTQSVSHLIAWCTAREGTEVMSLY